MAPATTDAAPLLEEFHRWLRERRLPVTHQRTLVARLVLEARDHPSADAIRRELERRGERVGAATVYRTLDLMLQAGCVAAHDFGDGHRRFEPMPAAARHEHLICRRCGRVTEFINDRLERMLHLIADEHGFLPERHRVEIRGLCPDCRSRDPGTLTGARGR
jgi:Fur family ferric uptake transcriptional regulator